jgi:hypothetical protein
MIAEGIAGRFTCAGSKAGYFGKRNVSRGEVTKWLYCRGKCRAQTTQTNVEWQDLSPDA